MNIIRYIKKYLFLIISFFIIGICFAGGINQSSTGENLLSDNIYDTSLNTISDTTYLDSIQCLKVLNSDRRYRSRTIIKTQNKNGFIEVLQLDSVYHRRYKDWLQVETLDSLFNGDTLTVKETWYPDGGMTFVKVNGRVIYDYKYQNGRTQYWHKYEYDNNGKMIKKEGRP